MVDSILRRNKLRRKKYMPMDLLALIVSIGSVVGSLLGPAYILFTYVQQSTLTLVIGLALGILLMLIVLDYIVTPFVSSRLEKTLGYKHRTTE